MLGLRSLIYASKVLMFPLKYIALCKRSKIIQYKARECSQCQKLKAAQPEE